MSDTLPSFPVDDVALDALEHALGASMTYDDDGEPQIVGAEFDLHRVLDFYSGYDPEKVVPLDLDRDPPVYEYVGGCLYHPNDVIAALIAEVRRLRCQ